MTLVGDTCAVHGVESTAGLARQPVCPGPAGALAPGRGGALGGGGSPFITPATSPEIAPTAPGSRPAAAAWPAPPSIASATAKIAGTDRCDTTRPCTAANVPTGGAAGDSALFDTFRRLQREFPGVAASWAGEGDADLLVGYQLEDSQPFTARHYFDQARALYQRALQLQPTSSTGPDSLAPSPS